MENRSFFKQHSAWYGGHLMENSTPSDGAGFASLLQNPKSFLKSYGIDPESLSCSRRKIPDNEALGAIKTYISRGETEEERKKRASAFEEERKRWLGKRVIHENLMGEVISFRMDTGRPRVYSGNASTQKPLSPFAALVKYDGGRHKSQWKNVGLLRLF